MSELEKYFSSYRKNIAGVHASFNCNGKDLKIIYADWTASGRIYAPIEELLTKEI